MQSFSADAGAQSATLSSALVKSCNHSKGMIGQRVTLDLLAVVGAISPVLLLVSRYSSVIDQRIEG